MRWIEKRPRGRDANIRETGGSFLVEVRLRFPDGTRFRRELVAPTRTAARSLRDDVYAVFNEEALAILAGRQQQFGEPEPEERMTLGEMAEACRDSWWPAKGRSVDVSDQYFQKLRDYVYPVLGEDFPIASISAADWDRILARLKETETNRKALMGTATIRKVKAVLSSALSCAVAHKRIPINPIKGLSFDPNPLAEADRLGIDAEEIDDGDDSPAKRPLTDADAAALLAAAKGTGIYPMVVLQLAFGLRIAEALAVRWGDFDPSNNELRVRFQVRRRRNPRWEKGAAEPKTILQRVPVLKSKAGRREIIVMPDAAALLATIAPGDDAATLVATEVGGLYEPRNAQRAFKALVRSLAEKKKIAEPLPTTHSMRSWRLSHWANVTGLPASHLMRLAGHSNIETTMRYYIRSDGESLTRWLAGRSECTPRRWTSPLSQSEEGGSPV